MYIFNYQNAFKEDDVFAYYVREVTYEKIPHSNLPNWLQEKKYTFMNMYRSALIQTKNDLIFVRMDASVTIEIVCKIVKKVGDIMQVF